MYLTEASENVREIFERLENFDDIKKLKFLIYIFDKLSNKQVNSKDEANPDLVEDDELEIFTLDSIGLDNNFDMMFLENLTMLFNTLALRLSKAYIDNGNVLGIHYNNYDKILLSKFEKLTYNEKLDVFSEIFIRLDNETLLEQKYEILELNVNGYEIANLISKLKK